MSKRFDTEEFKKRQLEKLKKSKKEQSKKDSHTDPELEDAIENILENMDGLSEQARVDEWLFIEKKEKKTMTFNEEIEKEINELKSGTALDDSKAYLSNEFYYENIHDKIKWASNLVTDGPVSKLAIRSIIEWAYREGKADGILETMKKLDAYNKAERELMAQKMPKSPLSPHLDLSKNLKMPNLEKDEYTKISDKFKYKCTKCGKLFSSNTILTSLPPKVQCPECGEYVIIGGSF